jgi:hypothetical protein
LTRPAMPRLGRASVLIKLWVARLRGKRFCKSPMNTTL